MTQVINFHWYKSIERLTAEVGDNWMYVGRKNVHYDLPQSPLANPYSNTPQAYAIFSENPIEAYRRWLWQQIKIGNKKVLDELRRIRPETKLVCWCAPQPCHANVILKAAEHVQGVSLAETAVTPTHALSIREPWCWLILRPDIADLADRIRLFEDGLIKDVENRSWVTAVRGWIYLHASKTFDMEGYNYVQRKWPSIPLPAPNAFQLGGIVGKVELVDCVTASSSRWFVGEYGFLFRNATPLKFRPLRGAQKFFKVEL